MQKRLTFTFLAAVLLAACGAPGGDVAAEAEASVSSTALADFRAHVQSLTGAAWTGEFAARGPGTGIEGGEVVASGTASLMVSELDPGEFTFQAEHESDGLAAISSLRLVFTKTDVTVPTSAGETATVAIIQVGPEEVEYSITVHDTIASSTRVERVTEYLSEDRKILTRISSFSVDGVDLGSDNAALER